jgi:hypothetical protein
MHLSEHDVGFFVATSDAVLASFVPRTRHSGHREHHSTWAPEAAAAALEQEAVMLLRVKPATNASRALEHSDVGATGTAREAQHARRELNNAPAAHASTTREWRTNSRAAWQQESHHSALAALRPETPAPSTPTRTMDGVGVGLDPSATDWIVWPKSPGGARNRPNDCILSFRHNDTETTHKTNTLCRPP